MVDESTIGLLLRAHARCSEQKHGEEYIHNNISASNCWEQAAGLIESAIKSAINAEQYVRAQEARKNLQKEIDKKGK